VSYGVLNELGSDIIEIQFSLVFIFSNVTDFFSIRKSRGRVHKQLKSFTHVNECDVQLPLLGVSVVSGGNGIYVNLTTVTP
jgi:hypothetical protein